MDYWLCSKLTTGSKLNIPLCGYWLLAVGSSSSITCFLPTTLRLFLFNFSLDLFAILSITGFFFLGGRFLAPDSLLHLGLFGIALSLFLLGSCLFGAATGLFGWGSLLLFIIVIVFLLDWTSTLLFGFGGIDLVGASFVILPRVSRVLVTRLWTYLGAFLSLLCFGSRLLDAEALGTGAVAFHVALPIFIRHMTVLEGILHLLLQLGWKLVVTVHHVCVAVRVVLEMSNLNWGYTAPRCNL